MLMEALNTYLVRLTNAQTLEELWAMHCARMADYGFDRLIYGLTRYRNGKSFGDPQDWVVLSNHDPAYLKGFVEDGMYAQAPMLKWALENDGFSSWSIIAKAAANGELSAEELRVLEFNRKLGVGAGYTVSFRSISPRAKGAMALTAPTGVPQSEVDAMWDQHGTDILMCNNVAHLKILTLPHAHRRQLTKRQREVLEWVGDGKTAQDIATIMGLTPATVEKHLRLARAALDVETTAQAVLKAAFANQMFVLDV